MIVILLVSVTLSVTENETIKCMQDVSRNFAIDCFSKMTFFLNMLNSVPRKVLFNFYKDEEGKMKGYSSTLNKRIDA